MGQPCARRLLYEAWATEPANTDSDPWPAIVGTAVHAWLADAFQADNARLGRLRWLVEQRVYLTDGLSGTADLFDLDTATVIDHKVLGPSSLKTLRTDGPPPVYRTQLHLYGYGYARAGVRVDRVAIAAYPRSGWLNGLHVWSEPYDPTVAEAALDRHSGLVALGAALDLDAHPDRWAHIPTADAAGCAWCPFWRGGNAPADGSGCPGPTPTEEKS
jgi:hypothetical protein